MATLVNAGAIVVAHPVVRVGAVVVDQVVLTPTGDD